MNLIIFSCWSNSKKNGSSFADSFSGKFPRKGLLSSGELRPYQSENSIPGEDYPQELQQIFDREAKLTLSSPDVVSYFRPLEPINVSLIFKRYLLPGSRLAKDGNLSHSWPQVWLGYTNNTITAGMGVLPWEHSAPHLTPFINTHQTLPSWKALVS